MGYTKKKRHTKKPRQSKKSTRTTYHKGGMIKRAFNRSSYWLKTRGKDRNDTHDIVYFKPTFMREKAWINLVNRKKEQLLGKTVSDIEFKDLTDEDKYNVIKASIAFASEWKEEDDRLSKIASRMIAAVQKEESNKTMSKLPTAPIGRAISKTSSKRMLGGKRKTRSIRKSRKNITGGMLPGRLRRTNNSSSHMSKEEQERRTNNYKAEVAEYEEEQKRLKSQGILGQINAFFQPDPMDT
jgi:hypothetical protein